MIGVNEEDSRWILAATEGMKEVDASWISFFQWLKGCELDRVQLITGDKCLKIFKAVREALSDAKHQLCIVHFYRNVFYIVLKSKVKLVDKTLKAIHAQENKKRHLERKKNSCYRIKSDDVSKNSQEG